MERDDYEAVYAALDGLYRALRERYPLYGEGFRSAWQKGRRDTLQAHGWTEQDFYAELDRRRRADSPSTSQS